MASDGIAVLGNTIPKPVPVKRSTPSKNWCFTFNNYTNEEYEALLLFLKEPKNMAPKFLIGKEVGEKGTPHLQGYVEFEKKVRMDECKKINNKIHWEIAKGNTEQNIKYCTKDKNFFNQGFTIKRPLKILPREKLWKWQLDLIDIIEKEPDDRTIHWFWEPKGGLGKTTFCKFLSFHYGAIPVEGKKNDVLFCAAVFDSEIYIFDFERSMEDYISYAAIEKIKNGYYMCAKYESKPIIRNCPHVIIMANFKPEVDKLSLDRWNIKRIRSEEIDIIP